MQCVRREDLEAMLCPGTSFLDTYPLPVLRCQVKRPRDQTGFAVLRPHDSSCLVFPGRVDESYFRL